METKNMAIKIPSFKLSIPKVFQTSKSPSSKSKIEMCEIYKLQLQSFNIPQFEENINEVFEMNFFSFPKEFSAKYQVLKKIGSGMQGGVYKIKEKENGHFSTAKIYYTKDEEKALMIKEESLILSKLMHENIIKFHAFYQNLSVGCYILVAEYFKSLTMKDFLNQNRPDKQSILQILKQIYNSLDYLHSQGIIHRDYNINNILIDPSNLSIKIIDFGLSRYNNQNNYVNSPQGNLDYRPPTIEALNNPFFEDIWNFAIVSLSLLLHSKMNSKKVWDLVQNHDQQLNFILST